MEDMLTKIIEMDEKASTLTENAKKEKAELEKEIIKTKKTIYNNYLERARQRIDKNEQIDKEEASKKAKKIKAHEKKILIELEELYKKDVDKWVNKIVERVIAE